MCVCLSKKKCLCFLQTPTVGTSVNAEKSQGHATLYHARFHTHFIAHLHMSIFIWYCAIKIIAFRNHGVDNENTCFF